MTEPVHHDAEHVQVGGQAAYDGHPQLLWNELLAFWLRVCLKFFDTRMYDLC